MSLLAQKNIILGVTGSIAAYKSADLVRRLREVEADVRVVMTANAKQFITPLTMQAVSGRPIHDDLFSAAAEAAMGHIELARWADMVLIAPASADVMARLAHGVADDLLTALCLVTSAPIVLAPAMNKNMWEHTLTQDNLQALKRKGTMIIGPAKGSQACGDVGLGRMVGPKTLIKKISGLFNTGELAGLRVLVTAGPTHEAIDPVRFMTNGSSGKMGHALAVAAQEAGARVTLVCGPVSLVRPPKVEYVSVMTAEEMLAAVNQHVKACDVFIAAAAVGDYRCQTIASQKIPKTEAMMQLTLQRNPDIVAHVGRSSPRPFIVGFAAETHNLVAHAQGKWQQKKMDMVVANRISQEENVGMGSDDNAVHVMGDDLEIKLPRMSKAKIARQIISIISDQMKKRTP